MGQIKEVEVRCHLARDKSTTWLKINIEKSTARVALRYYSGTSGKA